MQIKYFQNACILGFSAILGQTIPLSSAHAGFEWHPPARQEAPQQSGSPQIPAAPVGEVYETGPLSPMPLSPAFSADDGPILPTLDKAPEFQENFHKRGLLAPELLAPAVPETGIAPGSVGLEPEQVYHEGKPLRRQKPPLSRDLGLFQEKPDAPMAAPVVPPVSTAPEVSNQGGYPIIDLYPLRKGEAVMSGTYNAPVINPLKPVEKDARPLEVIPNDFSRQKYQETPSDLPFYSEAVGFGKNIPLALALGQIVPPDYPYAFAEGVDAGVRIDWQGGRPWNVVLSEAIRSHGLEAVISGKMVYIKPYELSSSRRVMPVKRSSADFPQESKLSSFADASIRKNENAGFLPASYTPEPAGLEPVSLSDPYFVPPRIAAVTNVDAISEPVAPIEAPEAKPVSLQEPDMPELEVQEISPLPKKDPWEAAAADFRAPDPDRPSFVSEPAAPVSIVREKPVSKIRFDQSAVNLWSAQTGSTLRDTLIGWSERAGVQLHWASRYDYPLLSEVVVQGTFQDAVETLLAGLMEANPRPIGRLHPNNPEGPAILIVETRRVLD